MNDWSWLDWAIFAVVWFCSGAAGYLAGNFIGGRWGPFKSNKLKELERDLWSVQDQRTSELPKRRSWNGYVVRLSAPDPGTHSVTIPVNDFIYTDVARDYLMLGYRWAVVKVESPEGTVK
jgi:hypothetical protein